MDTLTLVAVVALGTAFLLAALLPWIWGRFGQRVHFAALQAILLLHLLAIAAAIAGLETIGYVVAGVALLSVARAAFVYRRFRGFEANLVAELLETL